MLGFTMYETLYNTRVSADTVLVFRSIHFAADEKYDSYEWRIGDDPRVFTDSVVVLRFEQPEGDVDCSFDCAASTQQELLSE